MKYGSREVARSSHSVLVTIGLTTLLILISLIAAACGTEAASSTAITTVDAGSSTTITIRDTGIPTTSTTAASVPALASGIIPEQVLELVAARSNVPPDDWEMRDCTNLGDWAVANLYTSQFSEQMDERGVTAVFEKRNGAWFQAGWVSVSDPPDQQVVELTNMGAPEEVWRYFGLEPPSQLGATPPSSVDTAAPQPVNGGPGTPEYDGIPWPIVDGNVEGWWRYLGNGRFVTESGREFFWRNGRFVNPDGTLMEIPDSAKEHLHPLGIDHQPTIPFTLAPDKAALANEVEHIRKGLIAGTLVFDWDPPEGSDFSSDPREILDDLEASAYRPDVSVYFKDSAGLEYARSLRDEIRAMPEVDMAGLENNPVPAYLEIWLKDNRQSAEFAEKFKGRPEVDEVKAPSINFVLWTGLLRDMTHPKQ